MKKVRQLLAAIAISALTVHVAAEEPGITINGGVGFMEFDDGRALDNDYLWTIGAGYRFDNPFAIEVAYLSANANGTDTSPDADHDQWRVDGLFHLGADSGYLTPFLSAGIGNGTFDYSVREDDETIINFGVGAKYALTDTMAFRSDLKLFRGSDTDDNDVALIFSLHYAVGNIGTKTAAATPAPAAARPVDSDNDGVTDANDICPDTPENVAVNSQGCPRDADRDGVADYMDACPNTTNRAARIDERGCYVRLEETVRIELDVKFALDSAEVRPEHRAEVETVYEFMNEYPETKVTIEGHTDDTGAADYNQDLSQRRAQAIANMLVQEFGLDPERVSAIGYGESRPVASNTTEAGRAQNRRVIGVVEAHVETIQAR